MAGIAASYRSCPPCHEVRFHLLRAVVEVVARPNGVFLQIPTQFSCFDGSERSNEPPRLRAVDLRLSHCGWFIHQPGTSGGAAYAVLLMELQIGQFEDEFLQWLGLGLWFGGHIRTEPLAQRDQDRIHGGLDAARAAAHGDVKRFFAEELLQHTELSAIQRERDDRELVLAGFLPLVKRVAQLLTHPLGLQSVRADHDRVGRRTLDGFLDFGPQRIAAAQFARIDPTVLSVVGQRRPEIANERVVL